MDSMDGDEDRDQEYSRRKQSTWACQCCKELEQGGRANVAKNLSRKAGDSVANIGRIKAILMTTRPSVGDNRSSERNSDERSIREQNE